MADDQGSLHEQQDRQLFVFVQGCYKPSRFQKSSADKFGRSPSAPASARRHDGWGNRGNGRATCGRSIKPFFLGIAQILFHRRHAPIVDTNGMGMNQTRSCALAIGHATQADIDQKPRPDRNGERLIPVRRRYLYKISWVCHARKIQPWQSRT